MGIKRKPYFYDNQIKRLLIQIMACFVGYQVRTGNQRDGRHRMLDVPVIFGDMSETVAYIASGGSENVMAYVPIISVILTNMKQKAEWRQNPQHYEKYSFIERALSPDGTPLVNVPGQRKTIERYMPVPNDISVDVSIWTSNYDQAYQLVEQITTVFNPDMDIILSNSPSDWSFLTSLIFQGDVKPEKAVPTGVEMDPMYIHTMSFDTVVWLSPPVRVYENKPIQTINVPIKELEEELDFDSYDTLDGVVIKADEDDVAFFESLPKGDSGSEDDKL